MTISIQSGAWLMAHPMKRREVTAKTAASGRSTRAWPQRSASLAIRGVTVANRTAPAAETIPAVPYRPVTETMSMTWAMLSIPIGIRPMTPGTANCSAPGVLRTSAYLRKAGTGLLGLRNSCHVQHARRGPDYR